MLALPGFLVPALQHGRRFCFGSFVLDGYPHFAPGAVAATPRGHKLCLLQRRHRGCPGSFQLCTPLALYCSACSRLWLPHNTQTCMRKGAMAATPFSEGCSCHTR